MTPIHSPSLDLAMQWPGGGELLLILLIVLVVFGHNRIPALGDALGKGIKNFRKSFAKDEEPQKPTQREIADERPAPPRETREPADTKSGDKVL